MQFVKPLRGKSRFGCSRWSLVGAVALACPIPAIAGTISKPVANAPINWNSALSTGLISAVAVNEGSGSSYATMRLRNRL